MKTFLNQLKCGQIHTPNSLGNVVKLNLLRSDLPWNAE